MSALPVTDGVGFAAAGLVLVTFCMRSMSALRWVAIASNVAFIAYGYLGSLAPVLLLHALLLPVNAYRLAQLCAGARCSLPCQRRRLSFGASVPEETAHRRRACQCSRMAPTFAPQSRGENYTRPF
jgi:hypothetical protein